MSVEGEQDRSAKLDEKEVRSLKRRLSRCPWPAEGMEQWATSERLQQGQGPGR